MMIEIEHKKKAYVAPAIEVMTCEASELMDASVFGPNQPKGEGDSGENAKMSYRTVFSIFDDEEILVETTEEYDPIDEVLYRMR